MLDLAERNVPSNGVTAGKSIFFLKMTIEITFTHFIKV